MSRRTKVILAAIVALALGVWAWRAWSPDDRRDVRRRLNTFATEFNKSTTDGLGTVARAARIGSYFTEDVVVELGGGSPPIRGREVLIGMASRLHFRTAAFTLELIDVNVNLPGPARAEVSLTAAFRRRSVGNGDESIDAQELALQMTKADGEWRISHVRAVEPFK